jgi:hypothetical protein
LATFFPIETQRDGLATNSHELHWIAASQSLMRPIQGFDGEQWAPHSREDGCHERHSPHRAHRSRIQRVMRGPKAPKRAFSTPSNPGRGPGERCPSHRALRPGVGRGGLAVRSKEPRRVQSAGTSTIASGRRCAKARLSHSGSTLGLAGGSRANGLHGAVISGFQDLPGTSSAKVPRTRDELHGPPSQRRPLSQTPGGPSPAPPAFRGTAGTPSDMAAPVGRVPPRCGSTRNRQQLSLP